MPGGDRTGPFGEGPLTGRGAGLCRGYDSPGFTTAPGWGRMAGRGFGRGRGGGRGWRNRFYATGQPGWMRGWRWSRGDELPEQRFYDEDDAAELRHRAALLKSELEAIERQLGSSKKKSKRTASDEGNSED